MIFEDLNAFFHVGRCGSFSRAATQMRTAQSALSRRVARLEHQLGTKLLTRSGRGVQPTEAGHVLMARAELLLRELEMVETDMHGLATHPTGNVRIAVPPTTGQILVPPLVETSRRLFPGISLYIREGLSSFIHDWIVRDEIDIALLYNPESGAELDVVPLLYSPLYLISPAGSGGIATDGPLAPEELFDLPLILPPRPHSLRLLVERYALEHGRKLRVVTTVDGMRSTKALVDARLGFTIFSYAGVYEEVRSGALRAIPLAPRLSWRLCMVSRKTPHPARAVLEMKRLIDQQIGMLLECGEWEGRAILPSMRP